MFMVWWNIFKGTCKVSVYFVIRSHQGCTYCKGSSYLTWLVSDCEWGLKFSDCALASLQCLRKDMWIWENIWLNPAKSYLLDILKKRGKNQKKKKNLFLTKLALFTVGILPVIHFFESYVQFKEVFTLS